MYMKTRVIVQQHTATGCLCMIHPYQGTKENGWATIGKGMMINVTILEI